MEDYVGRDDFVLQLGMLPFVTRILVFAHVPPGPAVEAALLHMSDVVGHQVVTQPIAFIDGTPQLTCFWLDCQANAIPDAIGVHVHG